MSWRRQDELGLARGQRSGLGRGQRSGLARRQGLGVGYAVLVASAVGLLVFGAHYPSYVGELRLKLEGLSAPVLARGVALLSPVKAFGRRLAQISNASAELKRLARENQELRGWKWRAGELERQLKDLRALAKVVRRPGVGFVTAQVLSVSPGPLRHSILVDVGAGHGVRVGDGVINGDGLVGIVAQVTNRSARVRLLDDPDTRVDVIVGRERVLGLMKGDSAGLAKIEISDRGVVLRAGDKVVTSGASSGVPRGLKVGMVVLENGRTKIAPYAALSRLEYVSVLLRPAGRRKHLVKGLPLIGQDGGPMKKRNDGPAAVRF